MKLRKMISIALVLILTLAALIPCGVISRADTDESTEALPVGEGASKLDGKKILFAGCSYSYYGGLVESTGTGVTDQTTRTTKETGLFVRLAAENGVKNLTVTDWCYGAHDLSDLFGGENCGSDASVCTNKCHLDDLVDRNYDIVVLQEIITPGYNDDNDYLESRYG